MSGLAGRRVRAAALSALALALGAPLASPPAYAQASPPPVSSGDTLPVLSLREALLRATGFDPARAGGAPVLALGPLTVDPSFGGRGIGTALMEASLDAARAQGHGLVLLVGDAPYYGRFGFAPVPPGRLVLPGPVDPSRFLWLELREGAAEGIAGSVTPDR